MANIYQLNGKSVYDSNGQTFDAHTGQVISAAPAPTPSYTAPTSSTPVQYNPVASSAPTPTTPTNTGNPAAYLQSLQQAASAELSKPSPNYDYYSSLQQAIKSEQTRQGAITGKAQQLLSSGAGSNEISNYYGTLSPSDQTLVKGMFGNSINPNYVANKGNVQLSVTSAGTGNTTSNSNGIDTSTLTPELQGLYSQLDTYLQQLQARGQVLNPNVQITPEMTAQFMSQAQSQIHPYYADQLAVAKDQLMKSLGYNTQQIQNQEKQAQETYGRNLDALASNSADQGFALSGIRGKQENQLASDTQNTLDNNRRTLDFNTGNALSSFAGQFGGQAALGIQTPSAGAAPRALPGISPFASTTGNQNLYQLDPSIYQNVVGSQQNSEKSATGDLASKLASNYTTNQATAQARALTL